ncbi:MAG: universal stress protein [Pseudomonadota bacterium]
MYQKVLVPLDGSELAECALSQVRDLAKAGCIGEVTLLGVVEPLSMLMPENIDVYALKNALLDENRKYLAQIQSQLGSSGVKAQTKVLEGDAAHIIVEFSNENASNLIVIATHGYTGMKKLMFGSVALRVLHDSHVPVLLIRPESCRI